MRVLITGASGYVAKFVAQDLSADHELVLLSRRHPSEGAKGPSVQAPFVRGDLAVLDAPTYLHLAYRPGVPLVRETFVRGRAAH